MAIPTVGTPRGAMRERRRVNGTPFSSERMTSSRWNSQVAQTRESRAYTLVLNKTLNTASGVARSVSRSRNSRPMFTIGTNCSMALSSRPGRPARPAGIVISRKNGVT